MGKAGEKQKRKPKFEDKKQSERFKETARQIGADQAGAIDQIIGEMGRGGAFPPCPSCGKAMGLVQVMPSKDLSYEERVFKCTGCAMMEAKIFKKD